MIIDTRDGRIREFYGCEDGEVKFKLSWDKSFVNKEGRVGAWMLHSIYTNGVWDDRKDKKDHLMYRGDYELVNYDE